MDESLIYRKTRLGASELAAATHGMLSPAARRVLILLDGRRSIGELAELFGAAEVEPVIFDLVAQGFAREVDPQGEPQNTTELTFPITGSADVPEAAPEAARGRRGLAWVVVLVGASALGAAAWFGVRGNRTDNTAIAAARSETPESAGAPGTLAAGETPGVEPAAGTRELPLSGLPPVTVTLASASEGRRGRAIAAAASAANEDLPATPPRELAEPRVVPRAEAAAPAAGRPAPAATPPGEPAAFPPRTAPAASGAAPEALVVAPRPAVVPVSTSAAAEATKLAAVTSPGEPRSDAMNSPVATASAAAVASPPAPLGSAATALPVSAGAAPDQAPQASALRTPAAGAGEASSAPADGQQLASVAPPPRPQSEVVQLRPRRHDPPEFPARAMRARVFEGHVLAHIWVTAEGKVEQVDIVKATPPRMFDDEVKRTLSKWTFDPPGRAADTTVEFDFKP